MDHVEQESVARPPTRWLPALTTILVAAALFAGCASARAKATEQMEELNRAALADMKKGRAKAAEQKLTEALRAGEEAELGDDPLMARTHLSLGAVYAGPLKNRDKGSEHMHKALEINPKARLTATFATPGARQTLASVRSERRAGARKRAAEKPEAAPEPAAPAAPAEPEKPEAAPEAEVVAAPRDGREPDLPANFPTPLYCPSPPDSEPEEEVVLRCAAAPGTRPGKVVMFYRPAGSENFTEVTMSRSRKGWYTGIVPASATTAKSVQYYVETRGAAKLASGAPDSPNLLLVREDGDDDGTAPEDDNPLADIERERGREHLHLRPAGKVWAALGAGSSYGWQPGGSLEFNAQQKVAAGMLGGGLVALLPEVGYQLTEPLAVSLQLRMQFLPTEGAGDPKGGSPASRAFAVLVRGTYAFGEDNLRPFVSVVAGGGDALRLKVPPSPDAMLVRSDTVKGGPFVGGAGVGASWHQSRSFALSGELRALVGAPTLAALGEIAISAELAF